MMEQILDETKSELTMTDFLKFLYRYNYFDGLIHDVDSWDFKRLRKEITKLSMPEFKEALRRFQLFYGLRPDQDPGPITQRAMLEPRCACPDIPRGAEGATGDRRWPIERMQGITAACNFDQMNLGKAEATRIYRLALDAWNKVCGCGLKFTDLFGQANINAGDGPIDVMWLILAWSHLPNGGPAEKLEQKFDTFEKWTFSMFLAVAIHELGHALGWHHLNDRRSILFPSWQSDIQEPQPIDVQRAVKTYGPASGGDQPGDPGTPPTPAGLSLEGLINIHQSTGQITPVRIVSVTNYGGL